MRPASFILTRTGIRMADAIRLHLAVAAVISCVTAFAQTGAPLRLEKTIALPDVRGRIDHMSFDAEGGRLFVAALGNDTLEVIDVRAGKRIHSIAGLAEPQGVLYVPDARRLYAACARDGTVRVFDAGSYQPLKTIQYGDDADNLRYDTAASSVYVGYGSGGLGRLARDGAKAGDIRLDAHPESFQLEKNGSRIFVNLPKSRKIAVIDRKTDKIVANWDTGGMLSNYPMTLDEPNRRLFVVTRAPPRLLVLDTSTGKIIATLPAVGDCDDVFYDASRQRIYATGGEGAISVFEQEGPDRYRELNRIPTIKGARTSFWAPDLSMLFVAARRQGTQPAAIRVYRALP